MTVHCILPTDISLREGSASEAPLLQNCGRRLLCMRLNNANFDVNKTFDDKGYTQYFLISAGPLIESDSERALLSVVTFLYSISLSFLTTDSMVTYYVIVSILMFISILGSRTKVPLRIAEWPSWRSPNYLPLWSPPCTSGACQPTRASGCSHWFSSTRVPVTRLEENVRKPTEGHMHSVYSWASFPWPQCNISANSSIVLRLGVCVCVSLKQLLVAVGHKCWVNILHEATMELIFNWCCLSLLLHSTTVFNKPSSWEEGSESE
jgi:hypothetical protein